MEGAELVGKLVPKGNVIKKMDKLFGMELKYFERIALEAGESREITFELPVRELAFWNMDMEKVVEPGAFRLWIAGDSASGEAAEFSVE